MSIWVIRGFSQKTQLHGISYLVINLFEMNY
jgi:hypothetical protein